MQIVINIPDKDVPNKQEIIDISLHFIGGEVCECTYPYIVLPKGHGRLIDEQDAIDTLSVMFSGNDEILNDALECIEQLPEVIEADGGDSE